MFAAQLQDAFYPPPFITVFWTLHVLLSAFFLVNLTLAVLWGSFATSMESERISDDATKVLKQTQEMQGALPVVLPALAC